MTEQRCGFPTPDGPCDLRVSHAPPCSHTREQTKTSPETHSPWNRRADPEGEWVRCWPEFETAMKEKLRKGFADYGDASFDLPPLELLSEILEELEDTAGWSMLLWQRVARMRDALERATNGRQDFASNSVI